MTILQPADLPSLKEELRKLAPDVDSIWIGDAINIFNDSPVLLTLSQTDKADTSWIWIPWTYAELRQHRPSFLHRKLYKCPKGGYFYTEVTVLD